MSAHDHPAASRSFAGNAGDGWPFNERQRMDTPREIDEAARRARDVSKVVDKQKALALIDRIDQLLSEVASLGGELYQALAEKPRGQEYAATTDEQRLAMTVLGAVGPVVKVLHKDLKPKVQAL